MGAKMPASHQRFFSMRNPFSRCIFFAVALLLMLVLTWRTDSVSSVRGQIMKSSGGPSSSTATTTTTTSQQPITEVVPETGPEELVIPVSNGVQDCTVQMSYLETLRDRYELQNQFQYMKRYVKVQREPIARKSITKLQQKFLPDEFQIVDLNSSASNYGNEECLEPIQVSMPESPFPGTANLSDYMFGVSTTFKRFSSPKTSSVKEWTYWMTDGKGNSNGAKLLLLLLDATETQITEARNTLSTAGIDADVFHSDSSMEMAVRYLTLVPTLYNHPARPSKKWLVVCDDDTFFPSPHMLLQKMEEYDPEELLYIGTLSEDVNNVDRHGSQAFGGAGVFISTPLGAKITADYQSCKTEEKIRESNSGWGPQGDILLRKCIYENSDVRLSLLRGLYQLDLYGDPSGFYESGVNPVSLHHFKGGGWHTAYPWLYTKLSYLAGEGSPFMRFRFTDDWIMTSTYSITHYPKGISFNTMQMERTFNAAPQDKFWNMDYIFGPQRNYLAKTGRKISWDLQEATYNVDNTVSQVFIRKADDWRWVEESGEPMTKMDGIIELVWTL